MSKANSEISRDVGTELLFENDRVRVWGMELAPGESSPYHRHESDYVYVYTTPSQISAHIPGEPEVARNYQESFVQYTEVGDGIEHHVTNAGDERHHQIIVELNPNPPKDTDGRREGSGRGWVRELQGRWPGVLG